MDSASLYIEAGEFNMKLYNKRLELEVPDIRLEMAHRFFMFAASIICNNLILFAGYSLFISYLYEITYLV